ncbi:MULTISPECIES: ATP-binding protein [unclassified Variovorax]|uniref:ATP-binding protein n=1 Tax=unclassified Variovorax TaxID=663243 RepID=UPI002B228CD6|nr:MULTISPECIES: ATP-binding protein [unclassified Variovorax]MEB0055901.1 ATP-binding protein [Variovorax sp. LG9.2]MEB0112800.1 ATP-binding protein [Variovorax sp. RTB1]
MRSLRGDLMKWLLGALGFGSLVLVMVAYVVTLGEMNEVLDENLREVAEAVAQYHASAQVTAKPLPAMPGGQSDDDGDLVSLVWQRDGTPVFSSNPRFALRFTDVPGPGRFEVAGQEWRTYTVVLTDTVVQAAQRTTARHQMAVESASKLFIPLVALIILLAGLIVVALRRGMRPLDEATGQIARRSALSLEPIASENMPREMQPLVAAFNELMQRLSNAFSMQRRFVADAAHELRSPVTALRLQLTLLDRAADAAGRVAASADLRLGIERSERLVEQLLQLSRAQPDVDLHHVERLSLGDLVRSVVAEFHREAVARGIDLGASTTEGISVDGDAMQLRVLLNNLVRNALRYSPDGSRVDVVAAIEEGRPVLRVIDNGPGISATDRDHVFERFRRGSASHVRKGDPAGSGLGLAIVHAIALRHGAIVSLHSSLEVSPGLEVRVTFG